MNFRPERIIFEKSPAERRMRRTAPELVVLATGFDVLG